MAAYAHNFVVSIIGPQGNPIREANDSGERTIRLPFESEYKIRLKNKNSLRAMASISIDGMDISPGRRFILDAGETLDVERFLQDGDLTQGSRFKFTEKNKGAATGELQDPTSSDLGRIEVRFYKELALWGTLTTTSIGTLGVGYDPTQYYGSNNGSGVLRSSGIGGSSAGGTSAASRSTRGGSSAGGQSCGGSDHSLQGSAIGHAYVNSAGHPDLTVTNASVNGTFTANVSPEPVTDLGGTAMGSASSQQFTHGSYFATEYSPISLTLRIKGPKAQEPKKVAVTISPKDSADVIRQGLSPNATPAEKALADAYLTVLLHQGQAKE